MDCVVITGARLGSPGCPHPKTRIFSSFAPLSSLHRAGALLTGKLFERVMRVAPSASATAVDRCNDSSVRRLCRGDPATAIRTTRSWPRGAGAPRAGRCGESRVALTPSGPMEPTHGGSVDVRSTETVNYANGILFFCVSIGLVGGMASVAGVVSTSCAATGLRRPSPMARHAGTVSRGRHQRQAAARHRGQPGDHRSRSDRPRAARLRREIRIDGAWAAQRRWRWRTSHLAG